MTGVLSLLACTSFQRVAFIWMMIAKDAHMCDRVDQLDILGMVIPPLIGNPYNGYINPTE